MPGPTILARIQHTLGRAFRETGQALDRVAIRAKTQAMTELQEGRDPAYIFDDHLSRHRTLMPLLKRGVPKVSPDIAYLAPCASLIGTVHIGAKSSVFYGAVLRADACNMGCGRTEEELQRWKKLSRQERSKEDGMGSGDSYATTTSATTSTCSIGSDSTLGLMDGVAGGIFIGENTNIQDGCIITSNVDHTCIGNGVTVGHCAQIHSAVVQDHSLIGMGAILNPGSKVETLSLVAAGAVVGKGQVVKSGELWIGNPARKLRDLTSDEKKQLYYQAEEYVKLASSQSNVMELGGGGMLPQPQPQQTPQHDNNNNDEEEEEKNGRNKSHTEIMSQ